MLNIPISIGKLILAVVLCTLLLIPTTIAMEASSGHYRYKPKSHTTKSSNEVKHKIRSK